MKVSINSVQFKADTDLKDFIQERISKLAGIYNGVIGSDVILKVDNSEKEENKIVEIKILVKGSHLFAKKQSKSFEEATDSAVEALRKQLVKYKEKLNER